MLPLANAWGFAARPRGENKGENNSSGGGSQHSANALRDAINALSDDPTGPGGLIKPISRKRRSDYNTPLPLRARYANSRDRGDGDDDDEEEKPPIDYGAAPDMKKQRTDVGYDGKLYGQWSAGEWQYQDRHPDDPDDNNIDIDNNDDGGNEIYSDSDRRDIYRFGEKDSNGLPKYVLPPPPPVTEDIDVNAWDEALDAMQVQFEELYVQETSAAAPQSYAYTINSDLRENVETTGAQRDRRIRQSLCNMGVVRSDLQERFCNMALQASARNIYGQDFDKCQEEIYARNGSTQIRHELLVQWPRRFGKTTVVAMLVAAIAAHVPGIRIAIFSTVQRTSKKLMEEVWRFIVQIPGAQERIGAHNSEELHILPQSSSSSSSSGSSGSSGGNKRNKAHINPAEVSIIYSYPASVSGTRGFTVHMIIIDEASHIDPNVWKYSIVPALGTTGMVLLALTTAQSVTNFFSVLIAKKNEYGEPLFETLVLTLVCDECQAAGRHASCNHRMHLLPAWKPRDRQKLIRQILGDGEDGSRVYQQEAMGSVLEDTGAVYNEKKLEEWFKKKRWQIEFAPQTIYSFFDPHGGGTGSSQGIVDVFWDGEAVVVSLLCGWWWLWWEIWFPLNIYHT